MTVKGGICPPMRVLTIWGEGQGGRQMTADAGFDHSGGKAKEASRRLWLRPRRQMTGKKAAIGRQRRHLPADAGFDDTEVPARRFLAPKCLHGGVCAEMSARRFLHGGAARRCLRGGFCTEVPARRCLHGGVHTEVLARRCLHRDVHTEVSARRAADAGFDDLGGRPRRPLMNWREMGCRRSSVAVRGMHEHGNV